MSNIPDSNPQNINQKNNSGKIPNLKEFIKYLDQTLKLFDNHIADEDFENKDSNVYKLFITLFNIYKDLDSKVIIDSNKNTLQIHDPCNPNENKSIVINKSAENVDNIDINSIVTQHIENRKKQKKNNYKWENISRIESDQMAHKLYQKSLMEIRTVDNDGPIIFSDKITKNEENNNFTNKKSTKKLDGDIDNTGILIDKKIIESQEKNIKNNKNVTDRKITKKLEKKSKNKHMMSNKTGAINKIFYAKKSNKKLLEDNKHSDSDELSENVQKCYKNTNTKNINHSDIYTECESLEDIFSHPKKKYDTQLTVEKYEKTDDIDKKINKLKKILNK
jgi:hypothetical protein